MSNQTIINHNPKYSLDFTNINPHSNSTVEAVAVVSSGRPTMLPRAGALLTETCMSDVTGYILIRFRGRLAIAMGIKANRLGEECQDTYFNGIGVYDTTNVRYIGTERGDINWSQDQIDAAEALLNRIEMM